MCVTGVLLFLFSFAGWSQKITLQSIDPYQITIGYDQTTNIIFPYGIVSVDRGSGVVLAQKAKGVNNILQVKAAKKKFHQTNVSVVTSDGRFYSFLVFYVDEPERLNYCLGHSKAQLVKYPVAQDSLEAITRGIHDAPRRFTIARHASGLHLRLRNIFTDDSSLWFTLRLSTHAAIPFQPGTMRFFVRDKQRTKRTAIQEKELVPLYADALRPVSVPSPHVFSVGFKPFTIGKSQRLYVQLRERSGVRLITLPIRYKALLKARPRL